jgi:hypothetical protein
MRFLQNVVQLTSLSVPKVRCPPETLPSRPVEPWDQSRAPNLSAADSAHCLRTDS